MREGPSLGARVVRVSETASTMDDARALALGGAPEGTVVRAERQLAGRGRAGRAWASPSGGLWFSVILRPDLEPARWGLVPLAVGLGVADALAAVGFPARLKWPNDVQDDAGRKVAGVLCEARAGEFVIAGVGVNVNVSQDALPLEVREIATSVEARAGRVDVDDLLAAALAAVDARYRALESGDAASVLAAYRARSSTIGRRVRTAGGVQGLALDVDESGALVLEQESGARVTVTADEVHAVRS